MQVCIVSPYRLATVSGVTTMVRNLATGLRLAGHRVTILAPRFVTDSRGGPGSWEIPIGNTMANLALSVRGLRVLLRNRSHWDLLHLHQAHPVTFASLVLGRILDRPVVTTFHLVPPRPRGIRGLAERLWTRALISYSDGQVFVSEETRREFGGDGIVIYNGVDVQSIQAGAARREELRRALGIDGFVVAFMGRLAVAKGFVDLVRAAKGVREPGPRVSILSTGEIQEADKARILRETERDSDKRIWIHLGPRGDHLALLAAADAFALPSYKEGFPMSLLEAMAAGLPIIATQVGGIPELVRDTIDGFLVPPGDLNALSARLELLATDRDTRARLADNVVERAKQFDTRRMAASYAELFEKVVLKV